MHFGIVKNINDPLMLGRAKVKVYDIHDNIDIKDLGWSQVVMPGNTPAINGTGHSVNLAVGSLVCGVFLDPMKVEFLILGSLPTKTDVTTDDDTAIGGSPAKTTNEPDNNARVRSINPHTDEPTGTYEPASAFAPIYPYNNVYETESGHAKEYDDTPGAERIMERHMSGTQYEIQPDGTKIEKIIRDNYQLVIGHDTLEVKGNVKIIVSGNANLAVSKNLTAQVGMDMTTIVTGNVDMDVGGNVDMDVVGNVDMDVVGNSTSTITGNMTASIQGTTSLIGIDEDGEKLLSIDFDNDNKKITLDSTDVEIKGKLKVFGTTHTSETLKLDDHIHGQPSTGADDTSQGDTLVAKNSS